MAAGESSSPQSYAPAVDYLAFLKRKWTAEDFLKLLLFVGMGATLWYFYGVVRLYEGLPIRLWAWYRYEPKYNFEHAKLVPFIFAFLVWYHRDDLAAAKKKGSNVGLLFVALGCLCFALGVRTLQGRFALFSGPVLLYGIVLYLWGSRVARILLFPIVFLVFMIPVPQVDQATFRLQFLVTGLANTVCNFIGIKLFAVGTTLHSVDGKFDGFDIAEGCSGIRSLMAMVMVTSVYVHLTQSRLWKKLLILGFSVVFAIIGNAGRIVTIFMVAQYYDPKVAGGIYHEYSGFIFFPIALASMLLFSRLLELPYFDTARALKSAALQPSDTPGGPKPEDKPKEEISYDY